MNSNFSNRGSRGYQTHRSDRYRHPEQDNYRFDDYGASARGGYGNEGNIDTWGNQGNEMGGSRNTAHRDRGYESYGSSQKYGRRDRYSGERGGYASHRPQENRHDTGYSRTGSSRSHFGDSDYDNYERLGSGNRSHSSYDHNRDLYGSEASRRFQGDAQGRYDFDDDNYRSNRGGYGSSKRDDSGSGYHRGNQHAYGSSRHNYSAQDPQDMYGGSNSSNSNDQPYGMSGYYSGGYGDRNPGGGFVSSGSNYSDQNYLESRNRGRTFDRDRNYSERN